MKKNVIISVESRKGGVGKTTAALCISRKLLEKYAVLLIDTDITGTDIAKGVDSPFWQDIVNILKDTKDMKKSEVNLLSLFDKSFMNGEKLPSFENNPDKPSFTTDLIKINVIGSQIYSDDGKSETIIEPAILFDKLHGYWFVDFLKEIVEDFATFANKENKPVAIVFDNSPGYVGIAPAIQDWLTDLGPETGKFLMVTSLDSQDMQSCADAISILHRKYKEKWETSQILKMVLKTKKKKKKVEEKEKKVNVDYSSIKGDFFMKLTEYDASSNNKNSKFPVPFAFYKVPPDSAESKSKDSSKPDDIGNIYSEKPENYIGIIVNKVPESVIKKRMIYPSVPSNIAYEFRKMLGGIDSLKWSEFMVGYSPYLEYQFLLLKKSKKRTDSKLNKILSMLLHKIESITEVYYETVFSPSREILSPESFTQLNDNINELQAAIDTTLAELKANRLHHLANLIEEDWQPKSIMLNLRTSFYNLIENAEHPYQRRVNWEEFDDERIMGKRSQEILDHLKKNLSFELQEMEMYPEIRNTALFLLTTLHFPFERSPFFDEILVFFREMIKFELQFIEKKEAKRDLPRFLSSGMKRNMVIEKMLRESVDLEWYHRYSGDELLDIFHAFTSAQARLMQLPDDTQSLIRLIQAMVDYDIDNTKNYIPYVRKIAEDVIIHKTLTYNEVSGNLTKALSEAQYFADFDKVIYNIFKSWRLDEDKVFNKEL